VSHTPTQPRAPRHLTYALLLLTHGSEAKAAPCNPPKPPPTNPNTLARYYQQTNQLPCATITLQKALKQTPNSPILNYSLGITLYAQGQRQPAEAALSKSLKQDPNQPQAHLALGVIAHESNRPTEALTHWETALLLDPNLITAIDWIAKARIEAGQYLEAAEVLHTAPEDEELLLDLVVADNKSGLFDEAITRSQQAIAAHPDWQRVPTALATVLVQRNRYEEALAVLKNARETDSEDPSLALLYLRVLVLKGDASTAAPLGQQLLQQHPNDFDLLYLNGLLERQQGAYESATKHLQAAAALNPNHYDTRYNLGFALLKLHRPEEARTQLEQAITLDPTAPEAHFQLAATLRDLDQPEAVQQELAAYQQRMQTRAKHDRDMALFADAAQKLSSGDTAAAISLYAEVTTDAPTDPQAFYNLAMALDRSSDLRGERISLEQALKLRPTYAAAMNQLGYIASRENDTAAAEAWFRKAIAAAPQFAEAESNLGALLAGTGREPEAEQHFRAAVAANPRYADAWINLAATLASQSRFSEARAAAENAVHIAPHNSDAAQLLRSLPPTQPRGTAKP
jgi:tetratricopeptide (TPR) repeat protein